jgi:hypothetical protein
MPHSPIGRSPAYELTRCPVCDETETDEIADREDVRREVEVLWEFHQARLRVGVPAERLLDRVAFSQNPPIRIVQCRSCTHVYRNPRERESALADAYSGADPDEATLKALLKTQSEAYRAFQGVRDAASKWGATWVAFSPLRATRDGASPEST